MSDQIKVELQDYMGDDLTIANAAWTSSGLVKDRSEEDVARVINMLAQSGHAACFEAVVVRFWVQLPVAIDRQLMTHRWMSSNGLSGRYRTVPTEFLDMPEDVRKIAGKMLSEQLDDGELFTPRDIIEGYEEICHKANEWYQTSVNLGKASKEFGIITGAEYKRFREFVRGALPQHNMTERVITINLRSLCNFFRLRLDKAAQPEIQEVAAQMHKRIAIANFVPVALQALQEVDWII